jgi:hypothetical protein
MKQAFQTANNSTENEMKEIAKSLHARMGGKQLGILSHSGMCWFDILLKEIATEDCNDADVQRLKELVREKMESENWKLLMKLLELGTRLHTMTLEERSYALAFFIRKL